MSYANRERRHRNKQSRNHDASLKKQLLNLRKYENVRLRFVFFDFVNSIR